MEAIFRSVVFGAHGTLPCFKAAGQLTPAPSPVLGLMLTVLGGSLNLKAARQQ